MEQLHLSSSFTKNPKAKAQREAPSVSFVTSCSKNLGEKSLTEANGDNGGWSNCICHPPLPKILKPKHNAKLPPFSPLPPVQKSSFYSPFKMHPLYHKASSLTEPVISAAIEVHRDKGPGLIESIYEWCLTKEFDLRNLVYISQQSVEISYKGFVKQEDLRLDILVEGCLLIEAKAVTKILPIHKAQLLSYMRLLNVPVGLLINFNEIRVVDGVHRLILPGANRDSFDKSSDLSDLDFR
jgi:GxxExxY protein